MLRDSASSKGGPAADGPAARVLRALSRPGATLRQAADGQWRALRGGDGRRRPAVCPSAAIVATLKAEGVLEATGDGVLRLSGAGRIAASRLRSGRVAAAPVASGAMAPARSGFAGLVAKFACGAGPLDKRSIEGARRLMADWESAQAGPRLTQSWDAGPRQQRRAGSGAATGARQRFARRRLEAVEARVGAELLETALGACALGWPLNRAADRAGWPHRAAGERLAQLLAGIADAYDAAAPAWRDE